MTDTRSKLLFMAGLLACQLATAQTTAPEAADASLAPFHPLPAPQTHELVLKPGDRLAICGDSITEQKMYSRLMEDYLTMCAPELAVSVRQYGWSGERADGFLARMTNDCLRFNPTVATTCYGMNDHEYHVYEERVGRAYRQNSLAIVEAFKAHGVRVIQGSPGCVGKVPSWVKKPNGTVEDLNLSLCQLRNIGIEIAEKEKEGFADVFWPMLTAGARAERTYGASYAIAGADGVHPGWAGHTIMAYAFLRALGLKGDIGTFTVDLRKGRLTTSKGHELVSANNGEFQIRSSRYPFCCCVEPVEPTAPYPACASDDPSKDSSIRSAMTLIPFNQELNRLMLVGKHGKASTYTVTWGSRSKTFPAQALARGINLAQEFPLNPFCAAFAKVDSAVAAKQQFETVEIKQRFRSPEAKANMEQVVAQVEQEREPLVAAIQAGFGPVTHTIKIEAVEGR
ncbi:conserved exported hypothetical protein [Verrucomicrobia bacterium]|nr:conserved exported hypothetical protein [Verrucomicrobiota bacterium]